MQNPDFIIIGGGTAGAALASRLSEDAGTRVLLIEAGRDTPPDATPADIADTFPSSSLNRGYFWPELKAERVIGEARRPYPQARVMGGGSSVMGMWALRGLAADFDGWARAGAQGWGWNDVLPHFRRLEDDPMRRRAGNAAGSMPIRRVPQRDWPEFARAIERATAQRGIAAVEDINEQGGDGFFAMPLSQFDGRRASSAQCYLTDAVRRRANLAVMTESHVSALKLAGDRVEAVEIMRGGETKTIAARQVIVSAGAIHSPALLLRSGIGPASDLQKLGIAVAVDRPGVGANLQNHPYLHFALTVPPGLRLAAELHQFGLAGIRLSSGLADCPAGDLLAFALGRVSPRPYGAALGMFGAALYSPFSRGQVMLDNPDSRVPPRIDFRMLSDPRDPPRFVQAARFAESLLHEPSVAATYEDAFLLPPILSLHQFNQPGLKGKLFEMAGTVALATPPAIKRRLIEQAISPGRWVGNRKRRTAIGDDELLAAAAPMGHPIGTCAIGPADAAMAVLDPQCRVYGVSNLRVIDASVMPSIPSANTNLPTAMIAEKMAQTIRAERS
ncbi:MAG: GMC family oxidoreductase N-terminal domain-containing protein [Pseudolabrys sp.]|nr:GMC family oxidoreductase N-terminal domain-containing protein [Pseudolabrys sp.]